MSAQSGPEARTHHRASTAGLGLPSSGPVWLHYEFDRGAGAVTRTVDLFADGRITRNSIELEQRHGGHCPSLIDMSLDDGFAQAPLEDITRTAFEQLWDKGEDRPLWFPFAAAERDGVKS